MSIHTIALLIFLAVFYIFFFIIAVKSAKKISRDFDRIRNTGAEDCPCSHPCNEYCYNEQENALPGQIIKPSKN